MSLFTEEELPTDYHIFKKNQSKFKFTAMSEEENARLTGQICQLQDMLLRQQEQLEALSSRLTAQNGDAAPITRDLSKMSKPDVFTGADRSKCHKFLSQLNLYFEGNPVTFSNDKSKIVFAASFLKGKAEDWMSQYVDPTKESYINSYARFTEVLTNTMGEPDRYNQLSSKLMNLKDSGNTSDYTTEFFRLSSQLDWSGPQLRAQYYQGLKGSIKDSLSQLVDQPESLEELTATAIRIDNRMTERRTEKKSELPLQTRISPRFASQFGRNLHSNSFPPSQSRVPGPAPMEIDGTTVQPAERQRRFQDRACYYCGKSGHIAKDCFKRKNRLNSTTSSKRKEESPAKVNATKSDVTFTVTENKEEK